MSSAQVFGSIRSIIRDGGTAIQAGRKESRRPAGFGDDWLAKRSAALLTVPSAIVPRTFNVLLTPAHEAPSGLSSSRLASTRSILDRLLCAPYEPGGRRFEPSNPSGSIASRCPGRRSLLPLPLQAKAAHRERFRVLLGPAFFLRRIEHVDKGETRFGEG